METQSEKRIDERHRVRAAVVYSHFNTHQRYHAKALNFSHGGLYLEVPNFLKPGASLQIRVADFRSSPSARPDRPDLRSVALAEVKWCREIEGEGRTHYGVGLRYLMPSA